MSGHQWFPIGTPDNPFTGRFDGSNVPIVGLNIGTEDEPNDTIKQVGLFGCIEEAIIENVVLEGVEIYSCVPYGNVGEMYSAMGSLVGYAESSRIVSCEASGLISTVVPDGEDGPNIGGLIGDIFYPFDADGEAETVFEVEDCHADVNISTGYYAYAGGLIGYGCDIDVKDSSASGDVKSSDSATLGGLISCIDASSAAEPAIITGCSASGLVAIYGEQSIGIASHVGGLIGWGAYCNITDCVSQAVVQDRNWGYVGGLIGYAVSCFISDTDVILSLSESRVSGGDDATVGGLAGFADDCELQNCSVEAKVTGGDDATVGGLAGGMVVSKIIDCDFEGEVATGNAAKYGAYAGGIIGYGDKIGETEIYEVEITGCTVDATVTGENGTNIGGIAGYAYYAKLQNCSVKADVTGKDEALVGGLLGDGECTDIYASNFKGEVSVGSAVEYGAYAGGLVGWNSDGELAECTVDATVTGGDDACVGGLAGGLGWFDVQDCSVEAKAVTGGDGALAGGLIGLMRFGIIERCFSEADVSGGEGSIIGGLVGRAQADMSWESQSIVYSGASGSVTGDNAAAAGGLVGMSYPMLILGSYADGDVEITGSGLMIPESAAGGLVGVGMFILVLDSHASGNVTHTLFAGGLIGIASQSSVFNSFATGNVSGVGVAGGFIGLASASTIINNYAAGNVAVAELNVSGLTGSFGGGFIGVNMYAEADDAFGMDGEDDASNTIQYAYFSSEAVLTINGTPAAMTGIGFTGNSEGPDGGGFVPVEFDDPTTAMTAAEMKSESFAEALNEYYETFFDYPDYEWAIVPRRNNGMPMLAYQVTFYKNDGSEDAVTMPVAAARTAASMPAFRRSGYTLSGWNLSPDGDGIAFTSDLKVYGNMEVYAVWTESVTPPPPPVIGGGGGVPAVEEPGISIPADFFSSTGERKEMTVKNDKAAVTIPSDMLSSLPEAAGKRVKLVVQEANRENLPESVKAAIGNRPVISLTLTVDGSPVSWSNPGAPVTVTISYTPTAEELKNPEAIVILYIDSSGSAVPVPNCRYDAATGTVTFTTTHFSDFAVVYNPVSFTDVAENAWYYKAVSFLAARGVTNGTGGESYSPTAQVKRGDFLVMLMRACGIEPDKNPADNFADAGSTYYTGYLAAAKRLGLSAGVGDNSFAPEAVITRQEMFTLLYNVLKMLGKLPQSSSGKALSGFSDAGLVASWAQEALSALVASGVVEGDGMVLSPTGSAQRADMAQILYKALF